MNQMDSIDVFDDDSKRNLTSIQGDWKMNSSIPVDF